MFGTRECGQKMVCIDGICFTTLYDAGKFLMQVAVRRQPVTITQRHDWSACLIHSHPQR